MKFRILIVFFTIFFFILCQEDNIDNNKGKKKDNNIEISDSDEIDEIETENQDSENANEYIEITEDMLKNIELESIDFGGPLALSDFDMSLLLLCAYISHQALKNKYIESINQIAEKLNVSETKRIYDKIGAGFALNCYEYIDNETVNKYITNLTYHNNFQWEEEFDNYTKLDINKYKTKSDLKYTIEEQILLKMIHQSNEEFEKRKRERRNNNTETSKVDRKDISKEVPKPKPKEKNNNKKNNEYSNSFEIIIREIKFFVYFGLIILIFLFIMYCLKKKKPVKKMEIKKEKKDNIKQKKKSE
jgi:hypothetical protein